MHDVGFYHSQAGIKGRDGGPYLDEVEREKAEVQRARAEGREPDDLSGVLSAHVGTQLVTAPFVVDNSLTSNPSMALQPGINTVLDDATFQQQGHLARPAATLPVSDGDEPEDDGTVDEDQVNDEQAPLQPADEPTYSDSEPAAQDDGTL